MTARFADGSVPEPEETGELEAKVANAVALAANAVDAAVRQLETHRALEAILRAADAANRYLDARAPWKAAKDPARAAELRTTLYTVCQALRGVALLLAPFLPNSAGEILARLGLPDALATARLPEDARAWDALPPGTATRKGAALFPRVELEAGDA